MDGNIEYYKREGDIEEVYDFEEDNLGEGSFSVVKKAHRLEDSKEFAVKAIDISDFSEEMIKNLKTELYVLTQVKR